MQNVSESVIERVSESAKTRMATSQALAHPLTDSPSQPGMPAPSPDWLALRRDFPILDQKVHGQPLIYFDNAATSQKPRAVLDALRHYYERDNANVHRGIHELSNRATTAY